MGVGGEVLGAVRLYGHPPGPDADLAVGPQHAVICERLLSDLEPKPFERRDHLPLERRVGLDKGKRRNEPEVSRRTSSILCAAG